MPLTAWGVQMSGMKRSTERFLTTHTGSLPRPADLIRMMFAKEEGVPVDAAALAARVGAAVAEVVARQVEAGIAAWLDASTAADEKAVAARLNKAALEHVSYAPLGWYLRYTAWRSTLTGVTPGPIPFFWGVSKTV